MNDYLTEKLPGTGGTIKETEDDFLVEEIPLYDPCGDGEHLYIQVEKRGLTTFDMLQRLAKALGVRERELGYAGLKDARATTRQTVSITGVRAETVLGLELPGIRILSARLHRNKLRLGHLAGNRFRIRVRGVRDDALAAALNILPVLEKMGVPNRFGEQRYGAMGNSHQIGRAILTGNFEEAASRIVGDPAKIANERWRQAAERFAEGDREGALAALPGRFRDERTMIQAIHLGTSCRDAVLGMPRKLLRLYLSAYQGHLFDRLVSMRLHSISTLWAGDLACKHVNGAYFTVEDPVVEQERADLFEISPSAPLFGYEVPLARGQAGLLEEGLLEAEGLHLQDFHLSGGLAMPGERRPLRVPVTATAAHLEEGDLFLSFTLPKGSYATSVLREIIKPGVTDESPMM